MSDVFILGAGFSKAVSKEMPLLTEINQEIRKYVSQLDIPPFADDIEMLLTFLSSNHPWLSEAQNLRNHALFLDLSREIAKVINKCMRKATEQDYPKWLSELIQWWHRKRASVLTLNYDTLIERCASESDVVKISGNSRYGLLCSDIYPVALTPAFQRVAGVLGGKRVSTFQFFKLHGSINWFYSGSSMFAGETIYYVSLSGGWRLQDEAQEKEQEEVLVDKVPLIIPPMTEKTPYFQHETIRELWARAAAALRKAKRIFCLGYSLPETDIGMRFFLNANCPKNYVKLYLANIDIKVVDRFRSLLSCCYDIQTQFVCKDGPIPKLVKALVQGKLGADTDA